MDIFNGLWVSLCIHIFLSRNWGPWLSYIYDLWTYWTYMLNFFEQLTSWILAHTMGPREHNWYRLVKSGFHRRYLCGIKKIVPTRNSHLSLCLSVRPFDIKWSVQRQVKFCGTHTCIFKITMIMKMKIIMIMIMVIVIIVHVYSTNFKIMQPLHYAIGVC